MNNKSINQPQQSRNLQHILYMITDFVLTFAGNLLSFLAVYEYNKFADQIAPIMIYCGSMGLIMMLTFLFSGVYKIITKDIGFLELLRILATALAVQFVGLLVVTLVPIYKIGWKYAWVWLLCGVSIIYILPSTRLLVRAFNISKIITQKQNAVRTLVIGAGASGKVVIDESRRNRNNHNKVVVVVDDDPNKIGGTFANIPVKGPISEIGTIIDFYNIGEVIIAISDIEEERLHDIIETLGAYPVRVRRMPLISEMQGPNDTRIINVDLDDLLNRNPIKLNNKETREMLQGKTVMVTGAGGSIGSELVRQIFRTRPKTLILFDIYENSTYDIQMELTKEMRDKNITDIQLVTLIGSTYNEFRVEQVIKKYRPDFIYHAAAYKHVPLMEDSPAEAIRTNVIGTYNVAKMADKYKVKKMVLVSTDKAVRPTNVMGATKRFAETIIQYFAKESKHTYYAAVRFGNVLGSNGSVVPLFKKQIEAGGPITITDKKIIRYFMTIPEAVSLILQCGLFATGGEIFILDMGKPVKIINLAEKMIRQAGLVPYVDIKIVETGLRPGEKLYEELLLDVKSQTKTANKKIYIEKRERVVQPIEEEIKTISKVFEMEETSDVKKLLSQVIDTYTITENK